VIFRTKPRAGRDRREWPDLCAENGYLQIPPVFVSAAEHWSARPMPVLPIARRKGDGDPIFRLLARQTDTMLVNDAYSPRHGGRIAQLVEQLTLNQRVLGSSPSAPTNVSKHLEDLGGFLNRFGVEAGASREIARKIGAGCCRLAEPQQRQRASHGSLVALDMRGCVSGTDLRRLFPSSRELASLLPRHRLPKRATR
jgi:hypothetical protein